jgi:hypothetical protein
MYESAAVSKYKIGNVHLITIAGALGFAYSFYSLVLYIIDPRYGVNSFLGAVFMLGGFGVSVILYFALKFYRKSRNRNRQALRGHSFRIGSALLFSQA